MLRKFIFKDTAGRRELVLPVTPESFQLDHGIHVEKINIHEAGDINLAGGGALAQITINCIFPENDYVFSRAEDTPYNYVNTFERWSDRHTVLRFVISDTTVNLPVLVENIAYGEQDGTNDVYAAIRLQEYRELDAVETERASTGNKPRASDRGSSGGSDQTYEVKYGDTLCAICRRYYGSDKPAVYTALAKYNGRSNPNILYAGEVIKIPSRSKLGV